MVSKHLVDLETAIQGNLKAWLKVANFERLLKEKKVSFCNMSSRKTKEEIAELKKQKKQSYVYKRLNDYKHSSVPICEAILEVLPNPKDSKGKPIERNIDLDFEAINVLDSLKESSRKWAFSVHWLYTVCNPSITDKTNPSYSPVYSTYESSMPKDQFNELEMFDDSPNGLIQHQKKLVADSRYVKKEAWRFGTAWNDEGVVVKKDENGHPIYDEFAGLIKSRLDSLEERFTKKRNRDRHFEAFLIAHTRDIKESTQSLEPEHKGSHFHGVLDLPIPQSRYQIMSALGINFDDYIETFQWIYEGQSNNSYERVSHFVHSLEGDIKNFLIPDQYQSALQYLTHKSKKALDDQKTPYDNDEVLYWLPDERDMNYEQLSGTFDNEAVVDGIHSEIISNLKSPYNLKHHTSLYVGDSENKIFTFEILCRLRKAGNKKAGSISLTPTSQVRILNLIMRFIREGEIEIVDIPTLIHASFDDSNADELLADTKFRNRLNSMLQDEVLAVIKDPSADRNMSTVFISSAVGGIGKTRLATLLAQHFDKGRQPYFASTKDAGKTFDPFQDYDGEQSAILDELNPNSIALEALKNILEIHKIPQISSRFNNKTAWNIHHTFITDVFKNGVEDYVKLVLHEAPGVDSCGYLEPIPNTKNKFRLKTNDTKAALAYISQLSQILRRIPISIHMQPSANGLGTQVTVSIINFNPGGRSVDHYDYVHTERSQYIFDSIINEDTSDNELEEIVSKVAEMIEELKCESKKIFKKSPNILLDDCDGYISDGFDFGLFKEKNKIFLKGENGDESLAEGLFN